MLGSGVYNAIFLSSIFLSVRRTLGSRLIVFNRQYQAPIR